MRDTTNDDATTMQSAERAPGASTIRRTILVVIAVAGVVVATPYLLVSGSIGRVVEARLVLEY